MNFRRLGILFLVSAPSGAGKSTLCSALRQTPDFVYSVSCTTRAPRHNEVDGEHYHFITHEEFKRRIEADAFIEWAQVHGNYYGTPRHPLMEQLSQGVDVLLDIDTQGAGMIREKADALLRESLVDVFIMPPSMSELRRRLHKRGTETPEQVALRLRNAADEMSNWKSYRYTIITGSVEEDLTKFRAIMRAERYLSSRFIVEESMEQELDFGI